jgi:hypothetical protein
MRTIIGARGRMGRVGKAVFLLLVPLAAAVAPTTVDAQTCGLSAGGTLSNVINTYYPGTANANAGATSISVGAIDPAGASTAIAAGDLLLVIQMQDADIDFTNTTNYGSGTGNAHGATALNSAGLYEYVVAQGAVSGGAVSIVGNGTGGGNNGLVNSYHSAAATATAGKRTFQVIRVPMYLTATLSSTLTAARWDGDTGGVLAFEVAGVLTLNGATVNLDGRGFRGAGGRALGGDTTGTSGTDYVNTTANAVHGGKGEGIAGTPRWVYDAVNNAAVDTGVEGYPGGSMARGGPANAGGGGTDPRVSANDENAGGGGGANAGDGGGGGNSWNSNLARGGVGGDALSVVTIDRQILGGGGGAGDRNDCGPAHGAAGGGMVFVRAGSITGTATINARGSAALGSGNDGGGGGGAGGRVLFIAATGSLAGLTINVNGGTGGYANVANPPGTNPTCTGGTSHGPGGGGGGGAIFVSSNTLTASNVTAGTAGFTNTVAGTFTADINYGATAGADGFLNTGATQLVGVQPCALATNASVCGLRVDPAGTVEFATSRQRGTLGFDLFQTDDPTGRRGRLRLTDQAIASPVPSSATPILYRAETAPITASFIVIEETEVRGQKRMIGPFRVGDEVLRVGYERIERWSAEHAGVDRRGSRQVSLRRGPHRRDADDDRRDDGRRRLRRARRADEALKLETSAAGPVRALLSDLVAAGLPAAYAARPETLRLTNLGRAVPFRVAMDLTGARALQFTAEALATDYSGQNAYILSWGKGQPPAPSVDFTVSGFPRSNGFVRVEQNVFNAAFVAPGADPWIWDLIASGYPAGPWAFDLPGLRAGGGRVPVRVGLIGGSDHAHTVQAFINGQPAGTVKFTGKKAVMLEGSVSAGTLRATGNELSLTYTAPAATDEDPGVVFLDVLDLGASVAPPTDPVSIDAVSAYDAGLPAGAGADYLIVTHVAFAEQARRIAALKEAEGHRTWVVDVENAYDRFSGGVTEPAAVQALIRQGARAGVRSVLLVGDDTFDPRDFSGLGQESFVPSLMGWDGQFGRVPSENRYADVDGDGSPDVAIGRLPVQTAEEADVMVDKISRQADVLREAGRRHLLVVDNQGPRDPNFADEAAKVAALLGAGADTSWADVSQGVDRARTDLVEGLAAGPMATHYFGHGSEDFWADEHLFDAGQASSLGNAGHETLLFAWTCVSQNYLFGMGPSVGEAMLLAPEGGALATVGPTGITEARDQAVLLGRLYPHLLRGLSLGEALRRAKAETLRLDPDGRGVVEGWSLLGDPALTLPVEAARR